MRTEFILALNAVYPQVAKTIGDVAYDADGNEYSGG